MLKKLSLSTFKSFKNLEDLEIKDLTVIVGKNSCGKSSIIQSLLLLKQTLESSSRAPLSLEGDFIKQSNLKELTFGIPKKPEDAKIGYQFEFASGKITGKICLEFSNKKNDGAFEADLSKFYFISDAEKNGNDGLNFNDITMNSLKEYLAKNFDFTKKIGEFVSYKIIYDKFTPEAIEVEIKNAESKSRHIRLPILIALTDSDRRLFSELNQCIREIRYLSPIRAAPERAYVHYTQNALNLNSNGSNAAHVLWTKQHKKVKWDTKSIKLIDAVNECLKCIGLSQEISPDLLGDILYKVGIKESVSKSNVSIADVGFGYSQILPVILMCLINDENNLMLIEQPEIHLHPSSAANLADLFLNCIKDKKRFVIETHSQELINRLRLRVIENPKLKDKINIVFVESTETEGSKIKQFKIDEDGSFPEWPDGFLDESEKLAQAILEARLKKL